MPTIYDIDFSKFTPEMLPPDKRNNRFTLWVTIILSPLQYLRDLFFGSYRTGSEAPAYAAGTYAKYAQVKYNKSVYESLKAGNTDAPTVTASWKLVQQNFIGLSERIYYTGQKLTLEYAMNKWFGTTFRQPNLQSDIYITNNALAISVFRIAADEDSSSVVFNETSSELVINDYNFAVAYNFTVNCPVAVYNALSAVAGNREKIFRAFVDKYVPAGITYNIVTY
jgi:hypothetical protein